MLALLKMCFHVPYQLVKGHDTRIVEYIDSTDANGEKCSDKEEVQNELNHGVDHALPAFPLNLSGNRERSTLPPIHAMSESSRKRINTNTSTKAAVIRNLIMSVPPSDAERLTQPLQLVTVQAYDVRLTVAVALACKQHVPDDHIAVPYGGELVDA